MINILNNAIQQKNRVITNINVNANTFDSEIDTIVKICRKN